MSHARSGDRQRQHGPAGARPHAGVFTLLVCGALLAARVVGAGDGHGSHLSGAPRAARPAAAGNLLVPVRQQLSLGFFLAQTSIRAHPGCAALFSSLGADGLEVLARARYDGANFEKIADTCSKGGVPAYTSVGSNVVKLCPGFGVLTVSFAAVTVIHEALHSAGLSERPADPNGPTPQEINRMVQGSCGL